MSKDNIPADLSHEDYLRYARALEAFESLSGDLSYPENTIIMRDFKTLALLYASTKFGNEKLVVLRKKISVAELIDGDARGKSYKETTLWTMIDPKIKLLDAVILQGLYNINMQIKQENKIHTTSLNAFTETASQEISLALQNQNLSLQHFVSALKVHVALGGEVPVIAGGVFWEPRITFGVLPPNYEQEGLGYHATLASAHLAIYNLIVTNSETLTKDTPWGDFDKIGEPSEWNRLRLEWLSQMSFPEILSWYKQANFPIKIDFLIKKHTISSLTPPLVELKGLHQINLLVEH